MQTETQRLIQEAQESISRLQKLSAALEQQAILPGWFVEMMEQRLQSNAHRLPQWPQCSTFDLFQRIPSEVFMLEQALEKDAPDVLQRAADVANYAMMVADNYRREHQ